jgi:WD40 repeat protein
VINLQSLPSPKGHLFVSGSADGGMCTWDARSGTLIREHKGHREAVLGLSIGMQGSVVVSAGDDGVCLVFAV